jgi:hypothetical protein
MIIRPIVAALSLSLIGSAAFAQTPAATGADATLAGPGMTMGTVAAMPLKYVNIQDTDLVSLLAWISTTSRMRRSAQFPTL